MKKNVDWEKIDTKELAGLIFQHLKENGIEAVLVLCK